MMGNSQSKREAHMKQMEEMGVDTEVGFASFYFQGDTLCKCGGCKCHMAGCIVPPWGFGLVESPYEGVHKEVMPGLQQLEPEVNQIVVEFAEKGCGCCYVCDRGYKLDSVKKELTDKGWLAKVNSHLGRHGRIADLHVFTEGSEKPEHLQLRVFKLRNPARQQAMGSTSGVPRPLFMS